jgi:hypothetical protein
MPDDLSAEFESYRNSLPTEDDKQAFDRKIKQLLQDRGVDYVRGYVDGLKEMSRPAASYAIERSSPKAASKATEMAAEQIDKLADSSASDEEQQQRKRRLLKGPQEFRDIRGDLPKRKG